MGVGACMCICLACYRMAEDADEAEESTLLRKMRRSAKVLDHRAAHEHIESRQ